MFKNLSLKIAKQSASNLSSFLKESGYNIPKSVIFEGIAKVFFFKNWNTMEGVLSDPTKDDFEKVKTKVLFIKINKSKESLLQVIKESSLKAKCNFEIVDVKQKDNEFRIEFDFRKKGSDNYITLLMVLSETLKQDRSKIDHCYFWTTGVEKEDLTPLFKR